MRVLLDTHLLLWALGSPSKLSKKARQRIDSSEVYVSAASIWEISIKHALGKLEANPAEQKKVPQEKGMTQEPYDRTLVPDALRNSFCVPNLAQQTLNLKEFEAGKYPDGIIPPGCTR